MENIITTYSFDELSKESQQRALNKYRFYFVKDGKWYSHCENQWHKRGVNFEFLRSLESQDDHHDPSMTRFKMLNVYIDANTSLENVAINLKRDFSKKKEIYQKAKDYLNVVYDMTIIPELNFIKESLMTEIYKCILEQLHSEWHYLCSDESLMNTFEYDEWVFDSCGIREVISKVYEIDSEVFLEWYFEDDTLEDFRERIVEPLMFQGKASITAQEIFDRCGYVPSNLVEDFKDSEEVYDLQPNYNVFLKLKEDDKN